LDWLQNKQGDSPKISFTFAIPQNFSVRLFLVKEADMKQFYYFEQSTPTTDLQNVIKCRLPYIQETFGNYYVLYWFSFPGLQMSSKQKSNIFAMECKENVLFLEQQKLENQIAEFVKENSETIPLFENFLKASHNLWAKLKQTKTQPRGSAKEMLPSEAFMSITVRIGSSENDLSANHMMIYKKSEFIGNEPIRLTSEVLYVECTLNDCSKDITLVAKSSDNEEKLLLSPDNKTDTRCIVVDKDGLFLTDEITHGKLFRMYIPVLQD